MGKRFDSLNDNLTQFVLRQPVFFVASAPGGDGGHVNVSPKGLAGSLVVVDRSTVAYVDLTGSGVETIAHLRDNGRITLMFCAFEGPPLILRLFGEGTAHPLGSTDFDELAPHFEMIPGARSIIELQVDRVQTSCGFSIPFMDYRDERPTLQQWAERKGDDGLAEYWQEKNVTSIDGLPALDERG